MRSLIKTVATHRARHLVFGSGGTRAFLNGAGATFACHLAGVSNWSTVGGISGGSIPALLTASGMHPTEIVRHAVKTDFSELFKQTDTLGNMLRTRMFRRNRRSMRHGIVSSLGLGTHLESVVSAWPDKFWTMAVAGKSQFLFTANGVFLYRKGRCRRLSDKPAPISLAIRASCAVPGIIEAIDFDGQPLFDGALSRYGACPTGMANRHFGAQFNDIIAVDLVPRTKSRAERFVELLGRALSGTLRQKAPWPFIPRAGVVVRTQMESFYSLDFNIDLQRKQNGVIAGFRATCVELRNSGVLSDQQLSLMLARTITWESFEQLLGEEATRIAPPPPSEPPSRPHRRWYYLWLK